MVTFCVLAVLLQSVQMAHAFRWTSLLAKRSPGQMVAPPLPSPTDLGRQSYRKKRFLGFPFKAHVSNSFYIEYQADDKYDRGDMHISAAVNEGETIVYRTGSWYVDGVLVGDDNASPAYEFCRVETIQIVWTHNCEHGVVRGLAVDLLEEEEDGGGEPQKQYLSLRTPLDDVEFGPEQIIARICNVVWAPNSHDDDSDGEAGTCPIPLHSSMWKENDANSIYDDENE